MMRLLGRVVGRATEAFEPLRPLLASRRHPLRLTEGPGRDRTGLLVRDARPLEVLCNAADLHYVQWASAAHSFWRAQELSLIKRHLDYLPPPRLDFGVGDGSFGAALLPRIEYGVDTDADALAIATAWGRYDHLVQSTAAGVPLPDGVASSVISNSVLEHVVPLDDALSELRRLLRPGGTLAFTVPLDRYAAHLTYWFGARASRRVNAESSHHNLLSAAEWQALLARHGLDPLAVREYQPDWFTFWYRLLRLLGPRGAERLLPGIQRRVWRRFGPRLVAMVRASIAGTPDGANLFVLARRRPGSPAA